MASYQEVMAMICELLDIPNVRVTKYHTYPVLARLIAAINATAS